MAGRIRVAINGFGRIGRTVLRAARNMAPLRAPRPVAAMSRPSVRGPPPSTSVATTGSSTVKGTPSRLTVATSSRITRMGTKPLA